MKRRNPFFMRLLVTLLGIGCFPLASCADPEDQNSPREDSEAAEQRRVVLQNLGESVLETYRAFGEEVESLESTTATYASSLDEGDRDSARQAWRDAMHNWQEAEMYQIGPAGVMGTVVAGEDLRDSIYSWPIVNPCRIDQETVDQSYEDQDALGSLPINVRGLDALEYLLFNTDTDNACAPNSRINTDGSWSELDDSEIQQRRADYAAAIAVDLKASSSELISAWEPEGGGFLSEYGRAGDSSETYATTQEALNATSDAMFYLDKEVKDMKLAVPSGLTDCNDETCPDGRESTWADVSLNNVHQNLIAFSVLFHGGAADDPDAKGFDDLLRDKGADELADDMSQRIADAIETAEGIEGTMVEVLADDPQQIDELYDATKAVTDLFKSQFFDVLDLDVPDRGEGDND